MNNKYPKFEFEKPNEDNYIECERRNQMWVLRSINFDDICLKFNNYHIILSSEACQKLKKLLDKPITKIPEKFNKFSDMSDEEFDEYLKNKYGKDWWRVKLTDEEYERAPTVDAEKIREALKKGAEDMRKAMENSPTRKGYYR